MTHQTITAVSQDTINILHTVAKQHAVEITEFNHGMLYHMGKNHYWRVFINETTGKTIKIDIYDAYRDLVLFYVES